MRRFDDVIEAQELPPPQLVEEVAHTALFERQIAEYRRLWPEWDDDTEYDPTRAHLHVDAYVERLIRERINEAARATQLAYATGADLDIHGQRRLVDRKLLIPADPSANPPTPAVWEDDEAYRRRIQLAPESWSVAGPEGAYVFWAMTPETSADVTAVSPEPAEALITVMTYAGYRGEADAAAQDLVSAALDQEARVPFTDRITVRSVTAVPWEFAATLYVKPGADGEVVRAEAARRAAAYADYVRYIGRQVEPVGLYGALAVPGVERVDMGALAAGIDVAPHEVAYCEEVRLDLGVA